MKRRSAIPIGLTLCLIGAAALAEWPPPRSLDAERLADAGLRIVRADHATLVTDAAPSPAVDGLPGLVDLALPQWGERFGIAAERLADWRLRVYLIEDEARFRALGLWPGQSAEFPHGLSLGHEVWLRQQEADYYRRHLLLHEATHSFMSTRLGGCGPGWYMEGTAELCGTHSWDADTGELRLGVIPSSRETAPDWGRIRLVRDAVAEGRALSIDAVLKTDNRRVLPTEAYAWVWALSAFLDRHPAYRERFADLSRWVTRDDFDRRFHRAYAHDRDRLNQEWRLFTTTLAYGHDIEREAITFQQGKPLTAGGSRPIEVRVDRGWQSTRIAVEAGRTYHLEATGRFTIHRDPDGIPWPCEAGGVTLAYHNGRPLGELQATVDAGPAAFVAPTPIGLAADYTPPASGTLYLRVNDSPGALAENAGVLSVAIR